MGNHLKKQQLKLAARIKDFETVDKDARQNGAFKKPGSMNKHKQNTAGSPKAKVKRR